MDNRTFIAELCDHLAWPLVTLVIAFFLKNKILSLIAETKKIKWTDVEVEFDRKIENLKEQTEAKLLSKEPTPISLNLKSFDPKEILLQAWQDLEGASLSRLKLSNYKAAPASIKDATLGQKLESSGLLDKSTALIVTHLEALKNEVIHSEGFSVSNKSAINFAHIAGKITTLLKSE